MKELDFIQYLKSTNKTSNKSLRTGIGDDVAVIKWNDKKDLLFTTDMLVEDNHFSLKWYSMEEIGSKAIVSNVSDIAAMGGKPTFAVASVAKPKNLSFEKLKDLHQGLNKACKHYGLSLIGGDLTSSKHGNLMINIAMLGEAKRNKAILLSTAKPGDKILVTGNLGRSGAGLAYLLNQNKINKNFTENEQIKLKDYQTKPKTPLLASQVLSSLNYVSSMTDVSDGLASDIRKISMNSKVGAILDLDNIPVLPLVKKLLTTLKRPCYDTALFGGEDFELLFTAKENKVNSIIKELANKANTKATEIGEVISELIFYSRNVDNKLKNLEAVGYDQFGKNEYGYGE